MDRDLGRARSLVAALAVGALAPASVLRAGEDNAFHAAVARAIQRGREWLLDAYKRPDFPDHGYPMGAEALYLYALLKAGQDPDDRFIQERFRHLSTLAPRKTYSVALYMMALDARHRQRAERRGVREPGPIRGADRRRMETLLRWLLAARWQGEGVWTYGPAGGRNYDHSNSQFAVLGIEIALRNRLPVPAKVLEEIGWSFVRSQMVEGDPAEPDVTFRTPWFRKPGSRTSVRPKPARPGGWGYHGNAGMRSDPPRGRPTLSMSAAGLSNLLVVRNAFKAMRRAVPPRFEEAIRGGMIWITRRYDELRGMRPGGGGIFRNYYYTIYSIEKAGDLGEVARFGSHDWYREEAAVLVRAQDASGRWGDRGAAGYVHTSFALLFLTRATAAFRLVEPPTIITHADLKGEDRDKVFVDRLGGFVSAREFFGYLGASRDPRAVPLAREVLRNYPPDARPDLVPLLAPLLEGRRDAVAAFARRALSGITGIPTGGAEGYARWYRLWKEVREVGRGRDRGRLQVVLGIVKGNHPAPLKEAALWALARLGAPWVIGDLIEILPRAPPSLREPLHRTLCHLSGRSPPLDPARWDEAVEGWQRWWARQGTAVQASRSLPVHLDALEAAESEEDAEIALARVVAAGLRAVPEILKRMEGPEYSFFLVEALEAITGEHLGPERAPWAAWWAKRGSRAGAGGSHGKTR